MKKLDAVFAALSDETRRAILARLREGEARLSDLAQPFDMSQTAVSKHVRVLNDAGLIEIEKRGRSRHCRLTAAPLQDASAWLTDYEAFWSAQFDQLGAFLEQSAQTENDQQ
ncbi:MAG: metalloregulator ArsR/SmtB family transcription factor [Neomegalonema sp.]|nr:metalloregulator ArsR/SmtB family transcription factor [Neomegalonema sp.]